MSKEAPPRPFGSKRAAAKTTKRASARAADRPVASGDTAPNSRRDDAQGTHCTSHQHHHHGVEAVIRDLLRRSPESGKNAELIGNPQALLDGASIDEIKALRKARWPSPKRRQKRPSTSMPNSIPNGAMARTRTRTCSRKKYEAQKFRLQVELLKLQAWVKETGQRVVILFRSRDAAGKRHHQALHEHLNPRGARGCAGKAERNRAWPMVFPAPH